MIVVDIDYLVGYTTQILLHDIMLALNIMKMGGPGVGATAEAAIVRGKMANGKESHNGRQRREKGQKQESETEDTQAGTKSNRETG